MSLHKHITNIQDKLLAQKRNRGAFNNFQKKWKKRQKQKEKVKQANLPITELFDLEHKGKLK